MGKRSEVTEFGARLSAARLHAGKTRKEVCAALELGNSTVHDAETIALGSKHTPRFARLFGVSAHWLATGQGQMLDGVVARPDFGQLRLAAIYRTLTPELRSIMLDTARALYRHNVRLSSAPDAPATQARLAQTKSNVE